MGLSGREYEHEHNKLMDMNPHGDAAAADEPSEAAVPLVCGEEPETEPAVAVDNSDPTVLVEEPEPDEVVLLSEVGAVVGFVVLAGEMDGEEFAEEEEVDVVELDGSGEEVARGELLGEKVAEVVTVDLNEDDVVLSAPAAAFEAAARSNVPFAWRRLGKRQKSIVSERNAHTCISRFAQLGIWVSSGTFP
jgi:hypothetical protein